MATQPHGGRPLAYFSHPLKNMDFSDVSCSTNIRPCYMNCRRSRQQWQWRFWILGDTTPHGPRPGQGAQQILKKLGDVPRPIAHNLTTRLILCSSQIPVVAGHHLEPNLRRKQWHTCIRTTVACPKVSAWQSFEKQLDKFLCSHGPSQSDVGENSHDDIRCKKF